MKQETVVLVLGILAVAVVVALAVMANSGGGPDLRCNEENFIVPEGKFKQVAVADVSACAVRETGEIACWTFKPASSRCK